MLNSTMVSQQIQKGWVDQLLSMKDPRTEDWVTLSHPKYIISLLGGYMFMVFVWGPNFMRERKPYKLNRIIQVYNVFQVLANIYFCSKIAYLAYARLGYSPFCQGLTYKTDEDSVALLDNLYYYLCVRVTDFADTLFFILKKKTSHITNLHLIHHTIVVFSGWQFMQFGGDGQSIVGVCLNSTIHIIMYSYYFLASLGPEVQKYLWWKKYLTTLQIVQFVIMLVHGLVPAFVDCGYPRLLLSLALPQVFLILILFMNFYYKSYVAKNRGSVTNAASGDSALSKKVE